MPYLGVPFRKVYEKTNEIELLIMVTPELAEPMDAGEVPLCGPGMQTTSPKDWTLIMKGHLEVPKGCPGDCGGKCQMHGRSSGGQPSEGMILGPGESIPAPQPADAAGRPLQKVPTGRIAQRQVSTNTVSSGRYNRNTSPNPQRSTAASAASPNGPPSFIGPVGYDVVK